MEVRKEFGLKVRRTVMLLNARPSYAQRASKYAAMLPLAGMDPSEAVRYLLLHQAPSLHTLRSLFPCGTS